MKPYHQTELEDFIFWAHEQLIGAQLQDILAFEAALVLGFHLRGRGQKYLVLDLNTAEPLALLFDQNPYRTGKSSKPLALFLSSHGRNLFVESLTVRAELGRVFDLHLVTTDRKCTLQAQLVPKSPNLLVEAAGKKVFWSKPRELTEVETPEASDTRSIPSIHKEWWGQREGSAAKKSPVQQAKKKIEKDLEKKKKALAEIEKVLRSDLAQDWYRLGEILKTESIAQLDRAWDIFLDRKRSQSWNLENAFHKAKSLNKKKEGTAARKEILLKEISRMESILSGQLPQPVATTAQVILKKTDAKMRKKDFPSGVVAYLGKSATDNLKLLRRAQAWDIWLHLKDYPSAHAVIHRNKTHNVSPQELRETALWLAQESLQKKVLLAGLRLEIVYTECRFVRPIKGDKPGRVNYQNESHFVLNVTS